jgi:hypothetical protein
MGDLFRHRALPIRNFAFAAADKYDEQQFNVCIAS